MPFLSISPTPSHPTHMLPRVEMHCVALARLAISAVVKAAAAARRLFAWRRVLERGVERCCGGRRMLNAATSPARSRTASAAARCVERGILESEQPVFEQSGVD